MARKRIKTNTGQAMITSVVFFLFLSLTTITGLVSPTVRDYTASRLNIDSKKVYYLTESGSEDYLYRMFNTMSPGTSVSLTLENNTVTTTLHNGQDEVYINSAGSVQNRNRKVKVVFSTEEITQFNYGLQVGEGGVSLSSSQISGNVFSNGPITGDSSSTITGTAISATNQSGTIVASNGTGVPASSIDFGNASLSQDVAQSFRVSANGQISKVKIYMKRFIGISPPGDITVKIVNNNAGLPGDSILASGSLSATSVPSDYTWVEVPMSISSTLSTGTQYWLVLDVNFNVVEPSYYTIGATLESQAPYPNGVGMLGRSNNYWTHPLGLTPIDYYFQILQNGPTGLIAGSSGSQWNPLRVGTVSGTAQANTVNYVNATGNIYCQNGTGNNKSCTYQSDPAQESFPIPESKISDWKSEAESGGVHNGNYTVGWAGATLGPKKINGNLSVSGGGTLTVTGTLWVTGTITLSGGGKIVLSASYGSADGIIISDGTITISNGSTASGSGLPDSYIMLLTTSSSGSAISITGGSGAVILYAANGTLNVSGGATIKSATAYRIVVSGGSSLIYESGLANVNFSSGSGVASTVTIGSWREVE